MEGYKTEEEQVEALKKWWNDNGTSVIIGFCVLAAAIAGWQYWQAQKTATAVQASMLIEHATQALDDENHQGVSDAAGQILSEFSDTSYAPMAALLLAKSKYLSDDIVSAQTYLQWALDNSKDEGIQHIARIRLASVLWQQDKGDEALSLVNSVEPGKFIASYEELRGDIFASQGKNQEAIKAYEIAVSGEGAVSDARSLQLKIDALKSASSQ